MPRETPILVIRNEHDRPAHWKRFVAILCFIEFYVTFVYAGMRIWREENSFFNFYFFWSLDFPWSRISLLIGSFLLYICGRGLWRGKGTGRFWLWLALMTTSVMALCETAAVARSIWTLTTNSPFLLSTGMATTPGGALWTGIWASSPHLTLSCVLAISLWAMRLNNALVRTGRQPWVLGAASFCLISVLFTIFSDNSIAAVMGQAQFGTPFNPTLLIMA